MKTLSAAAAVIVLSAAVVIAEEKPAAEDTVTVSVVGTIRFGVVAIGGETTGVTITSKKITWELEFGKNAELQKGAEKLDGKKVVVEGVLERVPGVEIKERWIVKVSKVTPAK